MTKKLKDTEMDSLLSAYAKKESGKFGSDEDMFADLKAHFEKEKESKQKKRFIFSKNMKWLTAITSALLAGVIALVIILNLNSPSTTHLNIEDYTQQLITTEQEITDAAGNDAVLLNVPDYPFSGGTLYYNGNELIAYSAEYKKDDFDNFRIVIILKENYLSDLENRFTSNKTVYMYNDNIEITRVYDDYYDRTTIKFSCDFPKIYLEFKNTDNDLIDSVLDQIIY